VGWRRLGAVDVGEGHEEAISDAEDQSAEVDDAPVCCADLDGGAEGREQARKPKRGLAAEEVGESAGEDGREEGTEGEKGADQLLEGSLSHYC
jgi:hypothetical protein